MFHLVQDVRKMSFKDSADYLKSSVGMSSSTIRPNLQLVYDNDSADATKAHLQEKAAKIKYANKLYEKSKPLGSKSVASNYLQDHRGINFHKLSQDIKTTGIYDKSQDQYLPALIAYARDKDGNITGGQYTLLDKDTKGKADTDIQKRSFGSISGSFIDVGNNNQSDNKANNKQDNITIIAEGLETALSVNQALREHSNIKNIIYGTKVLCSLGISNIKNYSPSKAEKIIIAADNDGENAITAKTIENAKAELQAKGAIVEIVKPDEKGDFNDVLTSGRGGSYKIAKTFKPTLIRYSTKSLKEYFATKNQSFTLSEDEKHKIEFISKFGINEERIINAYRACPEQGRLELDKVCEPLASANYWVGENQRVIDCANVFGANINRNQLVVSMVGKSIEEIDSHIIGLQEKYSVKYKIKDFIMERKNAKTPLQALEAFKAHQEYLASVYEDHTPNLHDKHIENAMHNAYHNQKHGIDDQLDRLTKRITTTGMDQKQLCSVLKSSNNSYNALNTLTKRYQAHVMNIVRGEIKDIREGYEVCRGGKAFTCEREYVGHMIHEQRENEFFPKQSVQKIYNDISKQIDMSRSQDFGMSR